MAKKIKPKIGLKVPTINEINKRYGNAITLDASQITDHGLWIPSTFFALTYLTGGGIPYGKILEIAGMESSGKTLAAYNYAYCCQQIGGHVIWVDAEQAWTNDWALKNGLDLSKVTLITDTQVERISDALADLSIYWRSKLTNNEPILIVLDSIAALDTADAINAKMSDGKAEMGNRAKAIYKMFRIRNELFYKLGITQIYVNQLRASLSAGGFGDPNCLHYETNIPFVDGTSMKIGDIVREKISKDVWSFNLDTQQFEAKPIIDWVEKEDNYDWYQIKTTGPGSKNGVNGIKCTNDHLVLNSEMEWIKAQDVKLGDRLITHYNSRIKGFEEILAGVLVGDCSNRIRTDNTANLVFRDSRNPEYVKFKTGLLQNVFDIKSQGTGKTDFGYSAELGVISKAIHGKNGLRSHLKVWELFEPTWKSLAIWYMDDGHLWKRRDAGFSFSEKRTTQDDMIDYLYKKFGLEAYRANARNIKLTKQSSIKFFKEVASYIPRCMQYKLPLSEQGFSQHFWPLLEVTNIQLPLEVEVIHSEKMTSKRVLRRRKTYDITIKDNPNFLAGNTNTGIVVHNTTPGGKALAFYASIRLAFFGGKTLTKKRNSQDRKVGRLVTLRVMKNKVAPPRATVKKAPMYYDPSENEIGFDKYFEFDDILVEMGVIEKSAGGVYKYNGKTLIRGAEKFQELIETDKKLRRKLLRGAEINTIATTKKIASKINVNLFPVDTSITYDKQTEDEGEDEE